MLSLILFGAGITALAINLNVLGALLLIGSVASIGLVDSEGR